jgi:hypothetical protein
MVVNDSKKSPKIAQFFCCECCDYSTSKKTDYTKHLSTDKHKKRQNGSDLVVNDSEKSQKVAQYKCECGKIYKYDSGYYRHKKKCIIQNEESIDNQNTNTNIDITDSNIIVQLIKQNDDFKNLLIEQSKTLIEQNKTICELSKNSTTTNSNNNTNSHNKTFNLQFFLNETCKDAMNIMDFVDSIKLQLSDLEKVGKIGYVEGISNIIVKNLNLLDETKRPVHCTDSKREVMYVKDEDKWEKENETKMKLRKAIKKVAHQNSKMLSEFRVKHPDCLKSTSKVSDQYNKLVIEAMGGKGDDDDEKENKIIKKISDATIIDKEMY